ncbi:hypothetical protein KPH14_004355 [Odynerus spinipes]|uniref:Tether containing UBX domain for GLUT4 n=1 Tax=Odynerus spinipes TaxID=1348599 RepID=A0AAD9RYM5_9HYME|nr:hypothetical protein KPH14_004355 [Odynerus spinipes]
MAANKSVIVLLPNGRRQNVQVTPNTTILQVLEEVCQKHGYNVNDYDVKHFNKILDVNSILRFTGLPNNARIEMVPCTKPRSTSKVTVGILLENGERLMGDFWPDDTLAQILTSISPNENRETAVVIYMHREVHGKSLEETTLKSLGLTSGKAMLRLIHRDSAQLKTQAHVSSILIPKSSKPVDDTSLEHDKRQTISSTSYTSKALDPIALLKAERDKMRSQDIKIKTEEERSDNNKVVNAHIYKKSSSYNEKKNELNANSSLDTEEDINIEFLGERNALVFNQAGAQALPKGELPDSFFDLTVEDAKILLRDAKRRREELEEAPLLTETQRQFEQNKRTLEQLNKYRHTIIRIQFPDQLVLQASFKPLETVQAVKDFIKNYLNDPTCDFTIYTTPPKYILNPEARLIDENLVPSAILHYSGASSLKPAIKEKLTDPRAANIQAIKSRMIIVSEEQNEIYEDKSKTIPDIAIPGPSGC